MAKVRSRELMKLLEGWTSRTLADLDIRGRALRAAGYIEMGGRGPHAPPLNPKSSSAILLGVAGTTNASDAALAVDLFLPLQPIGGPQKSFAGATTLGGAIEAAMANPVLAGTIVEVRLLHPMGTEANEVTRGPIGIVIYREAEQQKSATYTLPIKNGVKHRMAEKLIPRLLEHTIRDSVGIGGRLIALIAACVSSDDLDMRARSVAALENVARAP